MCDPKWECYEPTDLREGNFYQEFNEEMSKAERNHEGDVESQQADKLKDLDDEHTENKSEKDEEDNKKTDNGDVVAKVFCVAFIVLVIWSLF